MGIHAGMTSAKERMTSAEELYGRWLDELWAGAPVANELVSDDFVGHWPDRDVHGPDELSEIVEETRSMLADLRFDVEGEPGRGGHTRGALDQYGRDAGWSEVVHRKRHVQGRRRPIHRVLDGALGRLTFGRHARKRSAYGLNRSRMSASSRPNMSAEVAIRPSLPR